MDRKHQKSREIVIKPKILKLLILAVFWKHLQILRI